MKSGKLRRYTAYTGRERWAGGLLNAPNRCYFCLCRSVSQKRRIRITREEVLCQGVILKRMQELDGRETWAMQCGVVSAGVGKQS